MARPKTYEGNSRAHIGVRYDKELIKLFDAIAARQGMTRNHAIEVCIKQVIQNERIPDSYFPDLEAKLAQVKSTIEPRQVKSAKDRLLDSDRKTGSRDGNKGPKVTQSL